MTLEKATITIHKGKNEEKKETVYVLFNPNQYTIQKDNSYQWFHINGLETPLYQFLYGEKETLTMELFFDSYAEKKDVRDYTKKITEIMKIDKDLGRPPRCTFSWGNFSFTGVIENISQTFTMFLPSGIPVRATLQVTFAKALSDKEQEEIKKGLTEKQNAQYKMQENEALSDVAYEYYDDPARWREIADANNIDNPRKVQSGMIIIIP